MLARKTGMTTTQVVEEALRAYLPPSANDVDARLVRKGGILVRPAGGKRVSLDEVNNAVDEMRAERG